MLPTHQPDLQTSRIREVSISASSYDSSFQGGKVVTLQGWAHVGFVFMTAAPKIRKILATVDISGTVTKTDSIKLQVAVQRVLVASTSHACTSMVTTAYTTWPLIRLPYGTPAR